MTRRKNNSNAFDLLYQTNTEDEQGSASALNLVTCNNDNTNMVPVTTTFNGENYLPWSKSVQRSLVAKSKIDFRLKEMNIRIGTNLIV